MSESKMIEFWGLSNENDSSTGNAYELVKMGPVCKPEHIDSAGGTALIYACTKKMNDVAFSTKFDRSHTVEASMAARTSAT